MISISLRPPEPRRGLTAAALRSRGLTANRPCMFARRSVRLERIRSGSRVCASLRIAWFSARLARSLQALAPQGATAPPSGGDRLEAYRDKGKKRAREGAPYRSCLDKAEPSRARLMRSTPLAMLACHPQASDRLRVAPRPPPAGVLRTGFDRAASRDRPRLSGRRAGFLFALAFGQN